MLQSPNQLRSPSYDADFSYLKGEEKEDWLNSPEVNRVQMV